jgi:hypothetical protein
MTSPTRRGPPKAFVLKQVIKVGWSNEEGLTNAQSEAKAYTFKVIQRFYITTLNNIASGLLKIALLQAQISREHI